MIPLSPRQAEVAELMGEGLSYAAIARRLGIKERTVRSHVEAIVAKLPPASGALPQAKRVMLFFSASRGASARVP